MKRIVIRKARPDDAAAIAAGEHQVAGTPGLLNAAPGEIPATAFRDTIASLQDGERGLYVLAQCGDDISGHVLLQPLSLASRSHVCSLTVVVYPAWQGRGIGRALLEYAIHWARQNRRLRKIELTVRADNARAISLYKTLGFEQEGRLRQRVKGTDGVSRDDIAMALFVG